MQIHIEAPETLPRLPAAVEVAAYYIVLEALTNVQKHARASSVVLSIELGASSLLLQVQDDGIGMSPAQKAKLKSHGLRGMKHRVDAFHGRFEMSSAPGRGTELRAELPLKDVGDDEPEGADDAA